MTICVLRSLFQSISWFKEWGTRIIMIIMIGYDSGKQNRSK